MTAPTPTPPRLHVVLDRDKNVRGCVIDTYSDTEHDAWTHAFTLTTGGSIFPGDFRVWKSARIAEGWHLASEPYTVAPVRVVEEHARFKAALEETAGEGCLDRPRYSRDFQCEVCAVCRARAALEGS